MSDCLGLKLQTIVNCLMWLLGTKLRTSAGAMCSNCRLSSPLSLFCNHFFHSCRSLDVHLAPDGDRLDAGLNARPASPLQHERLVSSLLASAEDGAEEDLMRGKCDLCWAPEELATDQGAAQRWEDWGNCLVDYHVLSCLPIPAALRRGCVIRPLDMRGESREFMVNKHTEFYFF